MAAKEDVIGQGGRFGQRIFTQETAVPVQCETKSQLCYLNLVI